MTRFRVIARPDGTDLRTGTVGFAVGTTVQAPEHAPFRLARSAIELVTLGAFDEPHPPWRVFEVEALRHDWDHDSAMNGYPYHLGHEVVVVEEVGLTTVLGFEPASRARTLEAELVAPRSVLEDRALAPLVERFLERCVANELAGEAAALRGLPVRATRPAGPVREPKLAEALAREAALVRADADNLAACDDTGAVRRYLDAVDAYAERFDCDEDRFGFGPDRIVQAHLRWKLVDPLLAAPPKPLVNLFEPLAELVAGGIVLLGWTEHECAVMRVR